MALGSPKRSGPTGRLGRPVKIYTIIATTLSLQGRTRITSIYIVGSFTILSTINCNKFIIINK